MKAKKLMTLCLVGILSVATMSTTVLANSTYEADQETTVKYIPNGGGPSGPIDPDNPDTDPNNWMVYYEKTVNLTQGNINTTVSGSGSFAQDGTKGKAFSFTVKRQVAGTITTTNTDGMQVSDQNLGAAGTTPTYDGTGLSGGGAIKVTADAANSGDWDSLTGNITLSTNNGGTDTPKMNLRTSGNFGAAAIVTETTSILSEMKSTHTTDTPSAAITSGITELTNDGSSYSVRLTYTFAKAVPTQNT